MPTVRVWIPGLLRDFTKGEAEFSVTAADVGAALDAAQQRGWTVVSMKNDWITDF